MATEFPAFLKIEHRDDGSARSSFLAEIDRTLEAGSNKVLQFSQNAHRQFESTFRDFEDGLGRALSRPRNALGSLDLGLTELREAQRAQEARAAAAEELARATRAAAAAEGDYSASARQTIASTEALAVQERNAAQATRDRADAVAQIQTQLDRQSSSTNLVIGNSKRLGAANDNLRYATLGATQQLQDMAISLYSGQRAGTVMAQQLPQLAFALSSLEGSTSKAADRIGKFATFMSGPWGLAIGLGAGVLATLAGRLIDTEDAADDTGSAINRLKDRLDLSKNSYDALIAVVNEYNSATERTEAVTLSAALATEKEAAGLLRKAKAQLALLQIEPPTANLGENAAAALAGREVAIRSVETRIAELEQGIRDAERAVADIEIKGRLDPVVAAQQAAERRLQILEEEQKKGLRTTESYAREKLKIEKKLQDETERLRKQGQGSGGGIANRDARIGDMVALVKQLFPGATITSTTGGKHTKGSDHYLGRAIDFVPKGGVGTYTTAQVERILEDAGVDIRRNARGTKQIFGPDRSASKPGDHNDHFHFAFDGSADPEKVAAAAQKAREQLEQFGEKSAEAIARVSERFDEQPRLIDQAVQATRRLDTVIADLGQRKPPGFEDLIAQAEQAKSVITDALTRPTRELREESERRLDVQTLLAQGRDDEAAALEAVQRLEGQLGKEEDLRRAVQDLITQGRTEEAATLQRLVDLYPDLKREAAETVRIERERTRELERQRTLFEAQVSVIEEARNSLQGVLSGRQTDLIGNLKQSIADLRGARLFDQLFAGAFDDLEAQLRKRTPLGRATEQLTLSVGDASRGTDALAQATEEAARRIVDATDAIVANDNGIGRPFDPNADIVVNGDKARLKTEPVALQQLSIRDLSDRIAHGIVSPLLTGFGDIFGTKFQLQLEGVLTGAVSGALQAGDVGAVLGGTQGLVKAFGEDIFGHQFAESLSKTLGGALQGAATGQQIAGIASALGINLSNTGSQIGGAIGSALPIPGGDIIGAIAGGIIGKLLGSTPRGSATIGGTGGDLSVVGTRGNKSKYVSAASDTAGSIIDSLDNIASQLGATIDASLGAVSIGIRDGNYRVDPTGRGITKTSNGAIDFGEDADAAARAATLDLIKDGVLVGLRAGTKVLLQNAKDLEKGLQDALDFEGVFTRLKQYKDPVGAALDALDKEFSHLIDLFDKAGASTEEYAQLEELYGIERANAIKDAASTVGEALKSLYEDLTIGGSSGLSLRTRQANALAEYSPLAERVAAGDTSAYDDYAEAARSLLEIERELYGSTKAYFDRLDEVTNLTRSRIGEEVNVASILDNRDSPFDAAGRVRDAVTNQTEEIVARLDAMIQNQGVQIQQAIASGGSGSATFPDLQGPYNF